MKGTTSLWDKGQPPAEGNICKYLALWLILNLSVEIRLASHVLCRGLAPL